MIHCCKMIVLLGVFMICSSLESELDAQDSDKKKRVRYGTIKIDGTLDDWKKNDLLFKDDKGDTDRNADLRRFYAKTEGSKLYLRLDFENPIDIDKNSKTRDQILFSVSFFGDKDVRPLGSILMQFHSEDSFWSKRDKFQRKMVDRTKAGVRIAQSKDEQSLELCVDFSKLLKDTKPTNVSFSMVPDKISVPGMWGSDSYRLEKKPDKKK